MRIPLFVFPLFVSILTPITCFVPYFLAVYYKQINPFFPYISDCGGILPQSSLFSTFLDLNAIFISLTAFIRYKQLKFQTKSIFNKISLILGFGTSFGALIIGNYRQTELIYGHGLGVVIAFGNAILYLLITSYLTFRLNQTFGTIRLILSLFCVIFSLLMLIFGILSVPSVSLEKFFDNNFRWFWSESDSGYIYHCLSALFEWLTVLTLSPFFATFIPEFKTILMKTDSNRNQINL